MTSAVCCKGAASRFTAEKWADVCYPNWFWAGTIGTNGYYSMGLGNGSLGSGAYDGTLAYSVRCSTFPASLHITD